MNDNTQYILNESTDVESTQLKTDATLTLKQQGIVGKLLGKGAKKLNLNYEQEFLVNLTAADIDVSPKSPRFGDNVDPPQEYAVKRTIKDFRKLVQILDKAYFGCYVPYIPQIRATEHISQSIIDHRSNNIEQSLVSNFILKLQQRGYLINSPPVAIFSDRSINTSAKLDQAFQRFMKAYEQTYLSSAEGTKKLLNQYKSNFGHLSGKEINQEVHMKVEQQMPEKLKILQKTLLRMKAVIEKNIVNFVDHQQRMKEIMKSFSALEQTLASRVNVEKSKQLVELMHKSEEKVCMNFIKITNESDQLYWQSLELMDNFVRDQMAEIDSITRVLNHIE